MMVPPANIIRPSYVGATPPVANKEPPIKTKAEIDRMRVTCKMAKKTLEYALSLVKPGITTDEIDQKVFQFIIDNGAYPSPLGYPCPHGGN